MNPNRENERALEFIIREPETELLKISRMMKGEEILACRNFRLGCGKTDKIDGERARKCSIFSVRLHVNIFREKMKEIEQNNRK